MISDRQIVWNRHRLWLPASTWQGGSIAGGMKLTEITVSAAQGLLGLLWDAGTLGYTASAVVQGKILIPKHFNPEWPIGFTVHFVNELASSTGAHAFTPTILVGLKHENSSTTSTAAAGVLNTIVPGKTGAAAVAAGTYLKTGRGIKNANWANRTQVFNGMWMEFSFMWLTLTRYTLASNARLWVTGLEIDYVPMLTRFPHAEFDAPLDDAMA